MKNNTSDSSKLIYEALERVGEIQTSMASMYAEADRYGRPPFLRFRFKGFKKSAPIYEKVREVAEAFAGNVSWTLSTSSNTENYILVPVFVLASQKAGQLQSIEALNEALGRQALEGLIDSAIDDLPLLAQFIADQDFTQLRHGSEEV